MLHVETTKLQKWDDGQGVRFNQSLVERMGLSAGDTLSIRIVGDEIIMKKIEKPTYKHKTVKERFAGYTGSYQPTEWDTGRSVGAEEV